MPGRLPGDGWPIAAASGIVGLVTIAGWLGTWVFSGRAWPAYVALALVPVWLMTEIAGTPLGSLSRESAATFSALLPPFVGLAMTYRASRSPDVDTAFRPLQKFGFLLVATAGVFAIVVLAGRRAPDPRPIVVAVGGVVGALAWGAAAAVLRRVRDVSLRDRASLVIALCAFSLAALDRTVGRLHPNDDVGSWAFSAGRSVVLVGWSLLLVVAARSAVQARRVFLIRQQHLRAARDAIADGLAEQRRCSEERRHDMRSLVAGIQGASVTLARYRPFLDVGEQRDLEAALLAEVDRLQHALSAEPSRCEPFALRTAVVPVITAERARGTIVNADLPDIVVLGSADATAALVQNLVTNARRHAPGATVTVVAQTSGDELTLGVSDDGPGLSALLRERFTALFETGRLSTATEIIPRQAIAEDALDPIRDQHGLGLTICARLAREQGGQLRLAATAIGTKIELTLRVAVSELVSDQR
jgi:signal transduction histidine kinase